MLLNRGLQKCNIGVAGILAIRAQLIIVIRVGAAMFSLRPEVSPRPSIYVWSRKAGARKICAHPGSGLWDSNRNRMRRMEKVQMEPDALVLAHP